MVYYYFTIVETQELCLLKLNPAFTNYMCDSCLISYNCSIRVFDCSNLQHKLRNILIQRTDTTSMGTTYPFMYYV